MRVYISECMLGLEGTDAIQEIVAVSHFTIELIKDGEEEEQDEID